MVFTGIVEGTGVVSSVTESENLTKISVKNLLNFQMT